MATEVAAEEPAGPAAEPPPLPRFIKAANHKEDTLVALSRDEHEGATEAVDLAFAFAEASDPAALAQSLASTLDLFPVCAGRYVKRTVKVEGLPSEEARRCILCNNEGCAFSHLELEGEAPNNVGVLPKTVFDQAVGTRPAQDGSLGGPLLRLRFLDFAKGGQLLALSFARGLADVGGISLFLRVWGRLHRGENPGPPPGHARTAFEAAVRGQPMPRVETGYYLLHRKGQEGAEEPAGGVRPTKPEFPLVTLCACVLEKKDFEAPRAELSEACRRKRFIYDSEELTEAEFALARVLHESMDAAVPASMWVDLRSTFFAESHFGNAHGVFDIDLLRDEAETAGVLHRHPKPTQSRDFWAWKRLQPRVGPSARVVLSSMLEAVGKLEDLGFGAGAPSSVTLGPAFWQTWVDHHGGRSCPGNIVLLPHAAGVQVMALLPRPAAKRLCEQRRCAENWHPE